MKEITLEQTLSGIFLLLFLSVIITLKVGGSSSLPELVEKDGYCKIGYGDNWDYDENQRVCSNFVNGERQEQSFTEQEFRSICPDNKFLSTKFYSECFHKGESR